MGFLFSSADDKHLPNGYTQEVDQETGCITLHPPSQTHKYSLVFLHGLGDGPNGIKEWIFAKKEFSLSLPEGCRVILPRAPWGKLAMLGRKRKAYTWYNIKSMQMPEHDEQTLKNCFE